MPIDIFSVDFIVEQALVGKLFRSRCQERNQGPYNVYIITAQHLLAPDPSLSAYDLSENRPKQLRHYDFGWLRLVPSERDLSETEARNLAAYRERCRTEREEFLKRDSGRRIEQEHFDSPNEPGVEGCRDISQEPGMEADTRP